MTKDLAVTLLAQGSTGNEILQILDNLMNDCSVSSVESEESDSDMEF